MISRCRPRAGSPSHRRSGGLLFVTWTFEDASYIEAAFASL